MRLVSRIFVLILLTLGIGFAGIYLAQSILKSPAQAFLDRLFKEDVSYQFQSYAAKISGKQSLHVAKLEQVEVIVRTSEAKALWLKLPKVVTRLEVPVEYNFYVQVVAQWKFERTSTELIVHVPELSAGTPAANISKMKLEVTAGNFIFNEAAAKQKLQAEVNTILIENSIAYREKVRDQARESIRNFVSSWLLQLAPTEGLELPIRIIFPGEDLPRPRS